MKVISAVFLLLFFISCDFGSKMNARLILQDTGILAGQSSDPNGNSCQHPEAVNHMKQSTKKPGFCVFKACKDELFTEYEQYLEYQYYVDKYGGNIIHDTKLCNTRKTPGKACAHPDGLNYRGSPAEEKGPCLFEACHKPNYHEYTQYLYYLEYVKQYGGEVIKKASLCKNEVGGCKLDGPYVTNYDKKAEFENGGCNFKGCDDATQAGYDADYEKVLNDYLEDLKDEGLDFNGSKISTCSGKLGCTYQGAENFAGKKEDGYVEDKSCKIRCCSKENFENYDKECALKVKGYQDLFPDFVFPSSQVSNEYMCGKRKGCTKPFATNYDSEAEIDDGSCKIRCCAYPDKKNYDKDCIKNINEYKDLLAKLGSCDCAPGNLDHKACIGDTPGCSFKNAFVKNFKEDRTEDGSCDIECCSKVGYENYDPKCGESVNEYMMILKDLGIDLKGDIDVNRCGRKVGCTNPSASNYDENAELEDGSCDITCKVCNDSPTGYPSGTDYACKKDLDEYRKLLKDLKIDPKGSLIETDNNCPVYGCMLQDDYVGNYNPLANKEDGSCDISCCGQDGSENYSDRCQKTIDDYLGSLSGPATGVINNNFNCGDKLGCNFKCSGVEIGGYTPDVKEDGTCEIKCCSKKGYSNYNPVCEGTIISYKSLLESLGIAVKGTILDDYMCGKKYGCTLTDPTAEIDDGSCDVQCCGQRGYENYDPSCTNKIKGYLGSLGPEVTPTGKISDYYMCGNPPGCNFNDPRVKNYSSNRNENGSCDIVCCAQEGYKNYDSDCQKTVDTYASLLKGLGLKGSGTIDTSYSCGPKVGCAFKGADNYQEGVVEDGTCNIRCCADNSKKSYDPTCQSNIDKYKFILRSNGLFQKGTIDPKYNCGDDIEGCNYKNDNVTVGGYKPDVKENGSCDIQCCSKEGYKNFNKYCMSAYDEYKSILMKAGLSVKGTLNTKYNCGPVVGCTWEGASNKDPLAKMDDGTCNIDCCSKEGYENYDPNCKENISSYLDLLKSLEVPSTGSLNSEYQCGKKLGCTYTGCKYTVGDPTKKEDGSCEIKCCGKEGYKNYDPACKPHIDAYKELLASLGVTLQGELSYEYNCGEKIGCMEPLADNYDPDATSDPNKVCVFKYCNTPDTENYVKDTPIRMAHRKYDGGVYMNSDCGKKYGCLHREATNYMAGVIENGSCNFEGCVNPNYSNYASGFEKTVEEYINSLKLLDIAYTGTIKKDVCTGEKGCLVVQANNTHPTAEVENGSCEFTGCLDPKATSYNATIANIIKDYLSMYPQAKVVDTCKYDPGYDCLCEKGGIATTFTREDQYKVLVINNPEVMSSLENIGDKISFGRALDAVKPSGSSYNSFVGAYIANYKVSRNPTSRCNGDAIPRSNVASLIQNSWSKLSNRSFDLDGAPYELLSVVYRPDLAKFDSEGKMITAGEGRLVFALDKIKARARNIKPGCDSQYGCSNSSSSTTTRMTEKPSHVIWEYSLPVTSSMSANDWFVNWAKLKCLKGEEYISHLRELIKKFAFTKFTIDEKVISTSYGETSTSTKKITTVPLNQIRVNDFREADFANTSWAMFEMALTSGKLRRRTMALTPKDCGSRSGAIRAVGQSYDHDGFGKSTRLDFLSKVKTIIDPKEDYQVKESNLAIQNTYRKVASWGEDFVGQSTLNYYLDRYSSYKVTPAQKKFAFYRYTLNSCNGCHTWDGMRSAGLDMKSPDVVSTYGQLPFTDVGSPNDFLHIHDDGSPSPFLLEDMIYRSEELEMHITDSYCADPGNYEGIGPGVSISQYGCMVDLNGDGMIDNQDVAEFQVRYALGLPQISLPDLNDDNRIDDTDKSVLQQIADQTLSISQQIDISKTCKDISITTGN